LQSGLSIIEEVFMTITSGSGIKIVFPIITVFDVKNVEEVLMEMEKEVHYGSR
jgi:hypothetical protein